MTLAIPLIFNPLSLYNHYIEEKSLFVADHGNNTYLNKKSDEVGNIITKLSPRQAELTA
jgi:hypothetical protein